MVVIKIELVVLQKNKMRKIHVLLGISNYGLINFTYAIAFPAYFKSTICLAEFYPVNSTRVIFLNINKRLKEENIKQIKKHLIKITLKKAFYCSIPLLILKNKN
tara:strand:- start:2292 stop:2603 length:312 start_codon:yes stop_codon:yes gene_type:complete